jgi:ATP-dependent DNA helicase RecG
MERTNDGFVIAEEDLKNRGSGNLMGHEQSGRGMFRYARPDDIPVMTQARDLASRILMDDPWLQGHEPLRARAELLRQTAHGE